ncbi:MAG TPA: DUF3311 domain-containing protein [Gemmatimonadaceae bacterium]|nr:DUF3311 domain-containing protein [Gemmatimonadaceae bacterium]
MRLHRWLAVVPAIGLLGGVPFANRVEPYVLGLPFLLFWILLWVLLTAAIMGVVYALDRAAGAGHEAGAGAPDERRGAAGP